MRAPDGCLNQQTVSFAGGAVDIPLIPQTFSPPLIIVCTLSEINYPLFIRLCALCLLAFPPLHPVQKENAEYAEAQREMIKSKIIKTFKRKIIFLIVRTNS
jgi:hypothetical protein